MTRDVRDESDASKNGTGVVEGTSGADLINLAYTGDPDGDMIDANDGVNGTSGDQDVVVAGAGNDTVDAGNANDLVYGGTGNDILAGGDGADTMYGGSGDDTVYGFAGNDVLYGDGANGPASDSDDGCSTKVTTPTVDGNDLITGGDGDDTLFGGGGNDSLKGGDGNDVAYGGTGDDLLAGNLGDDLLDGGKGNDVAFGGEGNDTLVGFEGNDSLYGEQGDDTILGGSGEDKLVGDAGDDKLEGGDGNDTLDGGDGEDDLLGGAGNDVISGGEGDDTIIGGSGSDFVGGGDGNDVIDTGGSAPAPDRGYPGLFAGDSDPLNDRDTVDGGAGDDLIMTGDDNDTISGGDGNDTIYAGFDDDLIGGDAGDDLIIAGEGSDEVYGGTGADTIYGGLGPSAPDALNILDATDLRPDNGRDTISGGDGNDVIFGQDDDDVLSGDAGNDVIDGGIDEDTIYGGTGDDTIIGGQGADSLMGEDDQDVFLVGSETEGAGDVIDGGSGGVDYDTLDLRGSGPLRINYDSNPENGTVDFLDGDGNTTSSLTFTEIENVIPCFTPGTLIATPKGERPVEDLRPGDRVITRDNGIQEIRWTGRKAMGWKALCASPHLKPVLIRQGSLGNGLPERDMMVSPNHRVLVANDRTSLYFEEHEVLVAAKHLVNNRGVHGIDSMGTSYIHFMFDQHEVVLSNGAWTESFQPGDYTLKGMGNAQRNEIFELFPELKTHEGLESYSAARRTLKRHEAELLLR